MKKIGYWVPSFIIAFVIFMLSARQRIALSDQNYLNFLIFKTLHIIEYAVFLTFNFRAVYNSFGKNKRKAGLIALLITVIYAFSDEVHQLFVPTREGRLRDVGFDTIGAGFALYCIWKLSPKTPRKLLLLAKKLEIYS